MTLKHPGMVNAYSGASNAAISDADAALIRRRQELLGPAYRLFYEAPLHIVRGEGVWLFDSEGRKYLDVYNNVVPVGHCHPAVVEAIAAQAAVLNTHTRYLHSTIIEYAERLLAIFPNELAHVMFTCTGSEANDLALRLARLYTGVEGVIVTELAYHGVTEAVAEISPSLKPLPSNLRRVKAVPAPDTYRIPPHGLAERFATDVREAISQLQNNGSGVAALIFDTIFSSDGVFADPPGFVREAVEAVHAAGGLIIADEVQAGFGRTGAGMWGFARHSFVPDLVTIGKPMGNGQPIAGVIMKPQTVEKFAKTNRYFNTFGGNPVSCAAALATLKVIQDEDLITNARTVGTYLMERLRDLSSRHSCIGDVRGSGLFIGVELVQDRATKEADSKVALAIVNTLRQRGILLSATGPQANVLKIRPPLVFQKEHADFLLSALDTFLSEYARS
jgi:4-aminobutyrate aminotransferase-like enzyme